MPPSVFVKAPAKVNLHLSVSAPTPNGFHPLRSWFRTCGLADLLSVTPDDAARDVADECRLEVTGPAAEGVPWSRDNLVRRAFAELREAGVDLPPVKVTLVKAIPAGGGVGGGSSNAAAALVAAKALAAVTDDELHAIAPRLGSDVPFFLSHHVDDATDATVTGRGEVVEPFEPVRRHAILLILPGLHVATPAVFKAFDALPSPADDGTPDFAAWSALPATELLPLLRNDLEAAALVIEPSLAGLRRNSEATLGRPVRMSGSGSTLFTLYDDRDEALKAAKALAVPTLVA